jgi:indole-3-glycerol phosphate synthase
MSILDDIVARTRRDLDERRRRRPLRQVQEETDAAPPVRDFAAAIRRSGSIQLIAEVKKASPSAGVIREDFDPVAIAGTYAEHGAAAVSVLTDEPFFQGSLADLAAIRREVAAPVLRKDFLVDVYQVWESRAAGADAVLLIAEILDDASLRGLLEETHVLKMQALVELYEPENLPRVLDSGARVVGVNNRNLRTFTVELEHTLRLRDQVPADRVFVSESGIRTRADAARLQQAGVDAMLVGETLMRSPDVGAKIDELMGRAN